MGVFVFDTQLRHLLFSDRLKAASYLPLVPQNIPGIDRNSVVTAHEVLAGHKAAMARKVVIVGGGMVGCETADFLALPSDNFAAAPTDVTLLEM